MRITNIGTFVSIAAFVGGCAFDTAPDSDDASGEAEAARLQQRISAYMLPTELKVEGRMTANGSWSSLTRYLAFAFNGETISIPVKLVKQSSDFWSATVDLRGNANVENLVKVGNRRYWDTMHFENRGGSAAFDIQWIKFTLTYDGLGDIYPTKSFMIAQEGGVQLGSGYQKLHLGTYGRRKFIQDYLASKGASGVNVSSLRAPVRMMIDDLGKSGSDSTDHFQAYSAANKLVPNPKYAGGTSKCTETISWYFAQDNRIMWDAQDRRYYDFIKTPFDGHGRRYDTPQFEVGMTEQMVDTFKYSDRLYCYHLGRGKFMKVDRSRNWLDLDNPDNEYAVGSRNKTDFAGDYLARVTKEDLHSMMVLSWDKGTGVAQTLDGPYPITVREVDVDARESAGHDYCIGKL